ncbi:MAG: hypothetical protein R3B68_10350 [Phycisphaerales bacterium]
MSFGRLHVDGLAGLDGLLSPLASAIGTASAGNAEGGSWLSGLLGLRDLNLGDEGVSLELAHSVPAWAAALLVVGAIALAGLTYRRLQGPVAWRAALAGLRALVIVLLLVLLAGPRLTKPNLATEADWVVVLVDRSSSMTIPDAPFEGGGEGGAERRTREAQLQATLDAAYPTLDVLAADRRILWLGFDAGAYELETRVEGGRVRPVLGEPTGRRTAIGASLSEALSLVAARPVAAVVVMSDGRSVDQIGEGLRERLKRVDVFGVALGSPEALPDLAITRAEGPRAAFVNDTVPVNVRIERLGQGQTPGATVRVIDTATGLVLGEQRVEPEDFDAGGAGGTGGGAERDSGAPLDTTITVRPGDAGKAEWRVEIVPDTPDLIARNNAESVEIDLVDRPVRVLYFDGYPRWDQRYIKNLLLREQSITGSALILSPDRRYAQDGDVLLTVLPRTYEDWQAYDVVILGDFRADLLSQDQARSLARHVATNGAGVLWIGGSGATPRSWAGNPLASLLPMTLSGPGGADLAVWDQDVTIWRTPLAERLGVLELGDPASAAPGGAGSRDGTGGPAAWPMQVSDPRTGWSLLRWVQRIEAERIKATAEVLAVGVPESAWRVRGSDPLEPPGTEALAEASPLVLSMRYGAGRVIYVATDEIWRWRYGRGEELSERFWIPLVRALARERLARTGQRAVLEITPGRARVDQPVRVVVRLIDQALVDRRSEAIELRVRRLGPTGGSTPAGVLRLAPEASGSAGGGIEGLDAPTTFAATWVATTPGRYIVETDDTLLSDLVGEIEVSHPDDELRRLETDHALLASLGEANAGRVLSAGDMASLRDLPSRARTIEGRPDVETLWDKPLALILLLGLLVMEWVGRRVIKLS